jgi:hypothetical protein
MIDPRRFLKRAGILSVIYFILNVRVWAPVRERPFDGPSPNIARFNPSAEPTATREFYLKHAKAEEVRIMLCGTLLAVPPHQFTIEVDEARNSLLFTDTLERVQMVAKAMKVLDQASREQNIQRRLMEMWVRIVLAYHA